jgi:hypothetical protein
MKISPLFLDLIQHQQCSTSLAESQSWPRKEKLDNLWGGRTSRLVIWQGLPDARRQASLLAAPQTSGGLRRRSHGTRDMRYYSTVDPSHLHPQRELLFKHGEALGPGIESSS